MKDPEGFRQRLKWVVDERFAGVDMRLAMAAGLASKSHVGMLLRGDVKGGSADTVAKIARAGKVRFEWLWAGQGERDVEATPLYPGLPPEQVAAIQWLMSIGATQQAIDELAKPRKGLTADQWIDLAKTVRAGVGLWASGDQQRPVTESELPPPPRARRKQA